VRAFKYAIVCDFICECVRFHLRVCAISCAIVCDFICAYVRFHTNPCHAISYFGIAMESHDIAINCDIYAIIVDFYAILCVPVRFCLFLCDFVHVQELPTICM